MSGLRNSNQCYHVWVFPLDLVFRVWVSEYFLAKFDIIWVFQLFGKVVYFSQYFIAISFNN